MAQIAQQQPTQQMQETAPVQLPVNRGELDLLPKGKAAGLLVADDSTFANLLDTARFEHIWRVAQVFAKSGMVPKQYDNKPEACFVATQMAVRLGVDPFMFMQNTYMSPEGRPAMYGQLAIALINARGPFRGPIQFELTGEGDKRSCRAHAKHQATGELCEISVDIAMAKAEGWYGRNPKWRNIPDQMLRYRSGAWFGRTFAPECLMGMQTIEEVEDVHGSLVRGVDGTFAPTPVTSAAAPPRPQRRDFVQGSASTGGDDWGDDWPVIDEIGAIIGEYRRADQWLDALENGAERLTGDALHTFLDNNAEAAAQVSQGFDGRYKARIDQLFVTRSAGAAIKQDANGNDPGAAAVQSDPEPEAAGEPVSWLVSPEAFGSVGKFQAEMIRLINDVAETLDDLLALERDNEDRMKAFESDAFNKPVIRLVRQMLEQAKAAKAK